MIEHNIWELKALRLKQSKAVEVFIAGFRSHMCVEEAIKNSLSFCYD